jgi:Cof subfamily protein (haloacid dehalogenase superfamily)
LLALINPVNGTEIRAMCTDIDGTLLDSQRQLSPQTIQTIKRIKECMPIILASSRMPSAMRHLQQELDIVSHPLICYNGGYVVRYDATDNADVISSVKIPLSVCAQLLEITDKTSVHVSLYVDDEWYAPRIDQWTTREATITKGSPVIKAGQEVLRMWATAGQDAHKIMIMGDADEVKVLEQSLRLKFKNELHIYHSRATYLEIAPIVISKASALKKLLTHYYHIDMSQVVAFGDNYNDIEMIQHAGLGIAVENARDEVKAVAREITLDSKLDGVAFAINKIMTRVADGL